ncbi:protein-tyrosine-phosphatase [Vibrio sp. 10N.286.49.C2]|uniref:low molecular weight protein-tyrosine-phosphatase n=1 Tax=unclassified Vibrio TaxID=2614977 RepID=UPI000C85E2C5|nr:MULTISPECIES: low molecular weight protein-tyrosine-phosphatase [unclassified Vibrio]PMH39618.1 protein-tyrosine-phosphatase [Vibrio sp. 10N.286.49.C2]PMH57763.1 protein-tyrosine-phosphatase [Vibrio sp. 10N.286.49.B1]PMH81412.1 protein-tyrosine-phosphatase [Vibrio sp. 10N.286.48.B7]
MKKVLVVCMGNICRSPTGEAVLRTCAQRQGLDILVDSAGTIGFHEGASPDPRAQVAAESRGYSFEGITARQVTDADFYNFDLILAADEDNLNDLIVRCPEHRQSALSLFLSHGHSDQKEIPDPYYGGELGFEQVLDLIEDAAQGVLEALKTMK